MVPIWVIVGHSRGKIFMSSDISCFFFSNVKIDVTHGKLENNKKIQFWTKSVSKPVLCSDREDEKACKEYGAKILDKGASKIVFFAW